MHMRIDDLLTKLEALVRRARRRDGDSDPNDFAPAVGVVSDLSRLLIQASLADVRLAQAGVSAVREQLISDEVDTSPIKELSGKNRHIYLAGAMWALTEVMAARLTIAESAGATSTSVRVTRRAKLAQYLLAAFNGSAAHSPSELSQYSPIRDLDVRPDEISRALAAMVEQGLVYAVPGPDGADVDRRRKYFALSPAGVDHRERTLYAEGPPFPKQDSTDPLTSQSEAGARSIDETLLHVVPNPHGGWDVAREQTTTAVGAHASTRAEAVACAKSIARDFGGGEVVIHGSDGRVRDGRAQLSDSAERTDSAAPH